MRQHRHSPAPLLLCFRSTLFLGIFTLILSLFPRPAQASHFIGARMYMECQTGCTTRLHLTLYRDCSAPQVDPANASITPLNGCPIPADASPWVQSSIVEATPICPSAVSRCTSPSAYLNGFQEIHHYKDLLLCGAAGCQYEFGFASCCRPTMTQPPVYTIYVRNTITLQSTCNNTPRWAGIDHIYILSGDTLSAYFGADDPDGDSLSYTLTTGWDDQNVPMTYAAGYSPQAPLGPNWVVDLDSATGMVQFIPQPGSFVVGVVCVRVDEWRGGNVISTSIQERMVTVIANPTNIRLPNIGPVTNLSGGTLLAPHTIRACVNTPICFDISARDPEAAQILTFHWDGYPVGGTFSQSGNPSVTDTIVSATPDAQFCWTTPTTPGVYHVVFQARDNACPLNGHSSQVVRFEVRGSLPDPNLIQSAGPLSACGASSTTLSTGSTYPSYLWSIPGGGSATTASISASIPGLYDLIVGLASGCQLTGQFTLAPPTPAPLSGTLTDHLSQPLAGQRVWLIQHDSLLNSLHAIDSTFTDSSGHYQFCGITHDTVYVKAAPDSAAYPNEIPTYADTAFVWQAARPIPAASFPTTVSFATRFGANPGGPGFIGGLISQGANKTTAPGDPMPGVTLVAWSQSLGRPCAVATSDANGYIAFPGLQPGAYDFYTDRPGISMTNIPSHTLSGDVPVQENLDFRLHSSYLELIVPSALDPGRPAFAAHMAPNPVTSQSALVLEIHEPGPITLKLMDMQGRVLQVLELSMQAGTHRLPFASHMPRLAAGTYILGISDAQSSTHIRIQTP